MRQRFFSLIELLMIVSILAILISLLLPALRKSRIQARTIECAGHFKQLALGFSSYVTENEDYTPMENCTACLGGKYTPCVQHRCMHGSRAKSLLGAAEATLYRKAHTYKEIDRVICCSAFMQSQIEKHPDLAGRTRVLHNFCTVPPRPQVEKEDYVLYFGRYDKEKGIDTLLAAAKALPQLHFVFAGSGTMAEEIQQLPNATDVGFCTGDDLYRRIAAAKCSIYPSVWYENCPYSVMESIALGTPVLGTNIGGIPELIEDGKTGVLLPPGDTKALGAALCRLDLEPERLAAMTAACRADAFLSVQDYTDKLLSDYNA